MDDVEVLCSPQIASTIDKTVEFYIEKESITKADGPITFYIKRAPKKTVINWILAQNGEAKVINPKELAAEITFFEDNGIVEIV